VTACVCVCVCVCGQRASVIRSGLWEGRAISRPVSARARTASPVSRATAATPATSRASRRSLRASVSRRRRRFTARLVYSMQP